MAVRNQVITDRYAIYEQKDTKKLVLFARVRLDSEEHAARFFTNYADVLLKKYDEQSNPARSSGFFTFDAPDGAVFLRCFGVECVTLEGAHRATFDVVNYMIGWPDAPATARAAVT